MARKTKYVPNRKEFQRQVLYNPALGEILASKLGPGAEVSVSDNSRPSPINPGGGGRIRARLYGSMKDEQRNGTLSRKLGGV